MMTLDFLYSLGPWYLCTSLPSKLNVLIKSRHFLKKRVKGRPCGSVAQLAEYSQGKREALGSSPGRVTIFSSPVTFGGQCGFAAGTTSIKGACLVVPPLFRADSGTNLIKQGENVKGRPCGSVAQWQSTRTVSERPWVQVPVGPRFFPPL